MCSVFYLNLVDIFDRSGRTALSGWENLRGAAGDLWVGVGSVFESGARARGKPFIYYFSGIGKHHTIQKKEKYGFPEIGCARGPQVQIFFLGMLRSHSGSFLVYNPTLCSTIPTLGWAGLKISGARARGFFFVFYFVLEP